jgi:hypothetical protein
MIENHLALILGQRQGDAIIAAICKLQVDQVYAAPVMYGYFLKRVDQRFQREDHEEPPLGIRRGRWCFESSYDD